MRSPITVDVGVSWKNPVWRTSVQSRFSFSRTAFDANAKGLRLFAGAPSRVRFHFSCRILFTLLLLASSLFGQSRTMYIAKHYLNIPVARASEMHVFQIQVEGIRKREFPVQLAEHSPDYWIFIDVSEFKGQTITLLGPSSQAALDGIYQADKIE